MMRGAALAIAFSFTIGCGGHRRPPPPPDDMLTVSGQTFVGDDTTCPPGTTSRRPHDQTARARLSVGDFKIDRRIVSCDDYERCVSAGVCSHSDTKCDAGHAAVHRAAATDYCQWRAARLPSWNEWQLAVRGTDGWEFPTGHTKRAEYEDASRPGGTAYTSALGVEFLFNATPPLDSELTRDDDCYSSSLERSEAPWVTGPILGRSVGMLFESLDTEGAERGSFRCVRD